MTKQSALFVKHVQLHVNSHEVVKLHHIRSNVNPLWFGDAFLLHQNFQQFLFHSYLA